MLQRRARSGSTSRTVRLLSAFVGALVVLGCGFQACSPIDEESADDLLARYLRDYAIPDPPQPVLDALLDAHAPNAVQRERALLADYARVRSPVTAGRLGALYSETEASNHAMAWLASATSAAPDHAEHWYWLGVNRYFLREPAEAKLLFERARELGARSAALERFAGEAELQLGRADLAASAFEKALELDSDAWHARSNLALIQEDRGELAAARLNLEHLIRLDPEHPTPHFRLTRILRTLGETEQAEASERRHRRAAILDDLGLRHEGCTELQRHLAVGWALASQGRFEDALVEYEMAANMTPSGTDADRARAGMEFCREGASARSVSFSAAPRDERH